MDVRKIIQRRIRARSGGVDVAGDVNAVVSANVGERGAHTGTSVRQTVTQRDGKTTVRSRRTVGGDADGNDAA